MNPINIIILSVSLVKISSPLIFCYINSEKQCSKLKKKCIFNFLSYIEEFITIVIGTFFYFYAPIFYVFLLKRPGLGVIKIISGFPSIAIITDLTLVTFLYSSIKNKDYLGAGVAMLDLGKSLLIQLKEVNFTRIMIGITITIYSFLYFTISKFYNNLFYSDFYVEKIHSPFYSNVFAVVLIITGFDSIQKLFMKNSILFWINLLHLRNWFLMFD